VRRRPLRRWIEKGGVMGVVGVAMGEEGEEDGGRGRGRVLSQRIERRKVSRLGMWVGERGGRGRVMVEIVCEGLEG
jgi:hypothetical protein